MIDKLTKRFEDAPDVVLTLGLLAFAGLLIFVALQRGHQLTKAAFLAWAIL